MMAKIILSSNQKYIIDELVELYNLVYGDTNYKLIYWSRIPILKDMISFSQQNMKTHSN